MRREDASGVPLAFQAQIPERGKIQYAGAEQTSTKWLNEWLGGCPPVPEPEDSSIPAWKRRAVKPTAGTRLPQFSKTVKTWEYTISWRMVTNGGQDDGVIRPVIGARGLPYFPGSSMKGAFRHACPPELVLELCGDEVIENGQKTTKPGILRFHGGYPTSMSWGDKTRLVDLVHQQQSRQVGWSDKETSANVLISLFQPTFKFGISSSVIPSGDPRWDKIKEIWEKALSYGLGSRVSAGYGYVDGVASTDRTIWSVSLKGQGLTAKLLNNTAEFRPNMFKATLRGHTLRILAGLISDEKTVKRLNARIWGDTDSYQVNDRHPVVGLAGVRFSCAKTDLDLDTFRYNNNNVRMHIYDLEKGKLEVLRATNQEISPQLSEFLKYILRFSLVVGGFGKSWRRTDHRLFYPSYLNGSKPMIGCHWEVLPRSVDDFDFVLTTNNDDLRSFRMFFNKVRQTAIDWLATQDIQPQGYINSWREVWHQDKVQVWGRIASSNDCQAVQWYHHTNRMKNTSLGGEVAGGVRKISRSCHRMYPRIFKSDGKLRRRNTEYIEVLTLFPDRSEDAQRFLKFIAQQQNNGWIHVW
ncbi:MAG: RAMP superfamily CRISPR-associated protein [Pseudanabaena sp. ELA607]